MVIADTGKKKRETLGLLESLCKKVQTAMGYVNTRVMGRDELFTQKNSRCVLSMR